MHKKDDLTGNINFKLSFFDRLRNRLQITGAGKENAMYTPVLTNLRSSAVDSFNSLRARASQISILTQIAFRLHLAGKNPGLLSFAMQPISYNSQRVYRGIQEIPIRQISGSVGRLTDFDRQFRPLQKHLRERWVNVFLLQERGASLPIEVFKAGDQYFVKDGHHRVSVARFTGAEYITAEVWEFALENQDQPCTGDPCSDAPIPCPEISAMNISSDCLRMEIVNH